MNTREAKLALREISNGLRRLSTRRSITEGDCSDLRTLAAAIDNVALELGGSSAAQHIGKILHPRLVCSLCGLPESSHGPGAIGCQVFTPSKRDGK